MEENHRQSSQDDPQQSAGKNQTLAQPEAGVVDYGRSGQPEGSSNQPSGEQSETQNPRSESNPENSQELHSSNPRPLDKHEGAMDNGELGGAADQ